jgi:hypothetical protein
MKGTRLKNQYNYNKDSKGTRISKAAITAARRAESDYIFRRSKFASLLHDEALIRYHERLDFFQNSEESQSAADSEPKNNINPLNSRFSSDIIVPLGSELFLANEKGPGDLKTSSKFISLDEFLRPDIEPDARSRIGYEDKAHTSAKIIAKLMSRNVMLRQYSALVIQRNYRGFISRKHSSNWLRRKGESCMILQNFYRRKKGYIRRRKEKEKFRMESIVLIQTVMRRKIVYLQLAQYRENYRIRKFIKLRLWVRKYISRRRHYRGKLRRRMLHATRIQAFFRGYLLRKLLILMHKSQRKIAKLFKSYWKR